MKDKTKPYKPWFYFGTVIPAKAGAPRRWFFPDLLNYRVDTQRWRIGVVPRASVRFGVEWTDREENVDTAKSLLVDLGKLQFVFKLYRWKKPVPGQAQALKESSNG